MFKFIRNVVGIFTATAIGLGILLFTDFDSDSQETFQTKHQLRERLVQYINPSTTDIVTSAQTYEYSRLSIPFFYDPTSAPHNLTKPDVLAAIQESSAAWTEACNISFDYKGDRYADYIDTDHSLSSKEGLIRWGKLDGDAIGQAHQGSSSGPADGFILTLEPTFFSKRENREYLSRTILHEMGHVIGLSHSQKQSSIMFWQQNARQTVLNETDKRMCRYFRARWNGLSTTDAQNKYGIIVNEGSVDEN